MGQSCLNIPERKRDFPHNPAQNGVYERMNWTLVETARSMMSHAKMPVEFWAEAIHTAVYLRNRSPTVLLPGITPFECLFNCKPEVSNLKVFGCLPFAHIPKSQRKNRPNLRKSRPKSEVCLVQIEHTHEAQTRPNGCIDI